MLDFAPLIWYSNKAEFNTVLSLTCMEKSRSQVERARLEIVYTP